MLAALQRNGGAIDVAKILQHDGNEEHKAAKIAPLLGESLFHNNVSVEEDVLNDIEQSLILEVMHLKIFNWN